eukprot:IDg21766t1
MNSTKLEINLWNEAIKDELSNLHEKGTWEVAGSYESRGNIGQSSEGNRVLPSHVVLKVKRNEEGQPVRFKARIVAGGNFQVQGKDFNSIYAPVVDFTLVLLALCIAEHRGWVTLHVDVRSSKIVTSKVADEFLSEFEGTNEGELKWYLGIKIQNTPNARELSQAAYVDQIISDYELQNMRTYNTPMVASFYTDYESLKDEAVIPNEQYRSMI